MGAFSIRDALPEDAAALISLRKAIFGETNFMLYAPSEYSASLQEVSAQLTKIRESGHSRSLLAETEGALIGVLSVMGSPIPRLRHSAQIVVGVLRSHWRQGVGRALFSEAIRWAPTVGLSRLELFVMSKNARAIALYEQLGFHVEGSRRRAYIIDGVPVDDQLMAYVSEA
jgi:RimJ/RimL family protein N-acetyltransferase